MMGLLPRVKNLWWLHLRQLHRQHGESQMQMQMKEEELMPLVLLLVLPHYLIHCVQEQRHPQLHESSLRHLQL